MDGKNGFTDTVNKEDTVTKKPKTKLKKLHSLVLCRTD